jgi:hypothetical protein
MRGNSGLLLRACRIAERLSKRDPRDDTSQRAGIAETSDDSHISRMLCMMSSRLSLHCQIASFCFSILAKLLRCIDELSCSTIVCQRGLHHALQLAQSTLTHGHNPCRIYMAASDLRVMLSVVTACFDPIKCWLRRHQLAALNLVDVYEHAVSVEHSSGANILNLVYHSTVGPAIECTTCYTYTILMDLPTVGEFQLSLNVEVRSHIVALYDCSLELSLSSGYENTSIQLMGAESLQESMEYLQLRNFADYLQRSRVTLLVCQKRVHPYLQRLLRQRSIILVYRVSVRYMAAVQALSGGRVHSVLPDQTATTQGTMEPSSLGFLHRVYCQHLFGRTYVAVVGFTDETRDGAGSSVTRQERLQDYLLDAFGHHGASFVLPFVNGVVRRQQSYCTVILTAPNQPALTRWRAVYEQCMQRLQQLSAQGPTVSLLPGNGMWQAYVARELRNHLSPASASLQEEAPRPATRVGAQLRRVRELFAQTLEQYAVTAGASKEHASTFGHDRIELFTLPADNGADISQEEVAYWRNPDGDAVNLRRGAGTEHWSLVDCGGVNTRGTGTTQSETATTVPPLDDCQACLQALQIAVDAVCALLSIDSVVTVEGSDS